MSSLMRRFWARLTDRGFFALGLVAGALSTLLFVLWIGHSQNDVSTLVEQKSSTSAAQNNHEKNEYNAFIYWSRRVFSLEDSVAQWLMMIFTVGAFVVLLATLKATRDVGKAQVIAYLGLKIGDIVIDHSIGGGRVKVSIQVIVENSGNSPAFDARIGYNIVHVEAGQTTEVIYDIDRIGHAGNPFPVIPPKNANQGATLARTMDIIPSGIVRFMYMIEFKDVFGDINFTPMFSGTLMESPNGGGNFVFAMDAVSTEKPI